jgi:hypothetical protein
MIFTKDLIKIFTLDNKIQNTGTINITSIAKPYPDLFNAVPKAEK